MKRKLIVGSQLVCILLLTLCATGSLLPVQAQIIAPPPPTDLLPVEILMSLMGRYTFMVQQYQDMIAQEGTPDSVIKFRLAARVIITDGETESELDSILTGLSRMAFWVEANIFNRYPNFVKIDLSGSLGDMEILTTAEESVIISHDEAVFSILTPGTDTPGLMPIGYGVLELAPADFDLFTSLELLQEHIGALLLEGLAGVDVEYRGPELTPRGVAHVVRLVFTDTGEIITLWVLDETWDLYKVELDDPQDGGSAIIVIKDLELVTSTFVPDSTFVVDTTTLAELPYEEFLTILGLKFLSVALTGTPVAADLSVSLSQVRRGEQVVLRSNGLDAEDEESHLVAQIQYRAPDGSWTPLEANYVGIAPLGHWEAAFAPSVLGSYDFRITYTDTTGAVSDPLELLAALDVVPVPPQVVDVSPGDRERDVLVSSQVAVTFSQAMDQASVESAFSLTDSAGQVVSGSYEWTEAAFVFKPDQDLKYGQSYSAKILDTAANLNAVTLEADLMWSFTTEYAPLPEVAEFSPGDRERNVLVSAQVSVTFTEAMDQASVESAFSLTDSAGQVVSGSFEWTEYGVLELAPAAAFVFKPDQDLEYGQGYLAKILGTAASLEAAALDADMDGIGEGSPDDDFVWRFTTKYAPLPKVAEFSPGDRELGVLVSAQVSVTFTEAMDQASVENAFSLTSGSAGIPARIQVVSGSFQWSDNTLTFTPSQALEYNATYRAEIRGSARSAVGIGLDADGDGIAEGSPKDDLSWWFSTERFPVLAVKPASQTALGGDFITVDIVAQTVSQLSSFALTAKFDPTILMILKVERASFVNWRPRPKIIEDVDMWLPTVIDDERGFITIAADKTRAGGVSGTGNIATLTFQAIGVGESPVQLQDVSFTNLLGEDMSPELRDGHVQVLGFALWDANKDGIVNIRDFIIILTGRGANTDVNGDGVTDILDVVAAAGEVEQAASPFKGVQSPPAFTLEPNFPNPFNPETWIPYQLAGETDVVIRIYSAAGQLVRSLDLGYKPAGRYITKAVAAHWDGTNEDGERVASGIYYYSIKAGDFSAVRKMVVSE